MTVSENQDDVSVEHHVVATEDNERGHHLHRAQHTPHNHERLCDPLLDKFAGVMNHGNIPTVLDEQKHMYVRTLSSLEQPCTSI